MAPILIFGIWGVRTAGQYLPTTLYYNFASNSTLPAWPNTFTLRVAIHFQEGKPDELYVWWLDGSQWVPIKMHTWVPNATGKVAGYSVIDYGWNYVHYFPVYWYHQLITTSFPAYVYSMYKTYDYVYTGVDDLLYTYYHLAPIDLVPGSNVIIVPQTGSVNGAYVYVYNITSTI